MKWHAVVLGVSFTSQAWTASSPEEPQPTGWGTHRKGLYPYCGKKGLMLSLHLHLQWLEGHGIFQNICLYHVLAPCWGISALLKCCVLTDPIVRKGGAASEGTRAVSALRSARANLGAHHSRPALQSRKLPEVCDSQIQPGNLWWSNSYFPKMFCFFHAGEFGREADDVNSHTHAGLWLSCLQQLQ